MLTEEQTSILRAVVDMIIPPDDFPGGWEGGVGNYLFAQFERDLRGLLGMYEIGLLAIDAEARAAYDRAFADLDAGAKESLLAQIEQGHVQTLWTVDPARFFNHLCHHCAEGYYSDPGNKGNRDLVAWKMIGFEVTA